MRSAPAPDLLPIPGMNQGTAIAAGSGGDGGGDGSAGDGGDGENASGGQGGEDAAGDTRSAEGADPVDAVTGRVYTLPVSDLELPGPLHLSFQRSYSSRACRDDQGLGLGWAHSFGWRLEVKPRRVRVWKDTGTWMDFALPALGASVQGRKGWLLHRDSSGFVLDAGDGLSRAFTVTFDGGVTYFLTALEDRNKNRIAVTFDDGKLVELVDAVGRVVKLTSTKEGRIASVEVKNAEHQGRWIVFARYEYDDQGRLVRVTDADDHSWHYEYDEFHRLICQTDRTGYSFFFRYDVKDRGIETWAAYKEKDDPSLDEASPKFLYDGRTRVKGSGHRKLDYYERGYTEVTDSTETRRYFGNKCGTVDKCVTGGSVVTSRYDDQGFEIERIDEMGAASYWVRDGRGRELTFTDPLGRCNTTELDDNGLPVRIENAAGGVLQGWRDARGNLESVRDEEGGMILFQNDERGRRTAVTDPSGAVTRCVYDARGSLVRFVQPNGGAWHLAYDALGRRVSAKGPNGAETRYAYSDRGDLVAIYDAAGGVTRYAYDGERNLTQATTPKGYSTQFTWAGFHRLCGRRDANGNTVRLAYSLEGELLALYNERDEAHRFEYDATGRCVGERTFDGRQLRYRYDAAGRMVRAHNGAGDVTTRVFDPADELLERQLPDDTGEAFEYDALGSLLCARNSTGEFRFERDLLGRVVREVQKVGDEEHWVEVTYGPGGERAGRSTSLGHSERIERDAMGSRVQTWLDGEYRIGHSNDVLGREVHRMFPGSGSIESEFDIMGRVSRRLARSRVGARGVGAGEPEWMGLRADGITAALAYTYDADGELIAANDRARGARSYEYDPVGQLLAAVPEGARAELFRFDRTGNLYEGEGGSQRTYGPGNRLTRRGDTEYQWDEAGRLVEKRERGSKGPRIWKYSWNGAGLLGHVETPDGERVAFSYDPLGRRMEKRRLRREGLSWATQSRTRFVWDGDVLVHELVAEHDAAGEAKGRQRTYWFEDDPCVPAAHRDRTDEVAEGAGWVHYLNEPNGTPAKLLNGSGALTCEMERSAWGAMRPVPGSTDHTPLRMRGQYEDEETGLSYNRWRYYDAELGLFLSADPIGLKGGPNSFKAPRNTLRYIDPFGLAEAFVPRTLGPGDVIHRTMKVGPDGQFKPSALDGGGGREKGARTYASTNSTTKDVRVANAAAMVGPTSTPPVDGHLQGLSAGLTPEPPEKNARSGSVDVGNLPPGLSAVHDSPGGHVSIIPNQEMTMGQYQTLLNQVPWK